MKKNIADDELDLFELFLTLWKAKWKIIFTAALAIIITFFLHDQEKPEKLIYSTITKFHPISTFDEFEYESYNSYLKSIDKKSIFHSSTRDAVSTDSFGLKKKEVMKFENEIYKMIENSSFKKINKNYLLNLFIDILNEKRVFIDAIKKFNLIDRVKYENDTEYENAVKKYASKIIIIPEKFDSDDQRVNSWNILFKTDDKDAWENVLFFIEKSTNSEILEYLYNSFSQLTLNEKRLKQYKIEDIEWDISNNIENIELSEDLKKRRKKLIENKDIERLVNMFNKTPIGTGKNFIAAKMEIETTDYQIINKKVEPRPLVTKLFLAGLFGAILAIIYALILNVLRSRVK